MPRLLINQLTENKIKTFIKDNKSIIADGDNLYLRKGSKKLYFTYRLRLTTNTGIIQGWHHIGSYPSISLSTARAKAREIRSLVERGINPKTYKSNHPKLGKTFVEIVELYKTKHFQSLAKNSIAKWICTMKRAEILNNIIMDKIIETDILEVLNNADKSNATSISAGILQRIKAVFKWAKKEKYIINNPTIELEKSYKVMPRERYLEQRELAHFFNSLFADSSIVALPKIIFISMATLMLRIEELMSIRWQDVDTKTGRVVIKQTKSIKDFRLIIPTQILELWLRFKDISPDTEYVFPFRKKYFRSVNVRNILNTLIIKYNMERFTPHDFRRTGMSLLSEQGHSHNIIDAALSHVVKGMDAFYMKSHLIEERAKLLNAWYRYIESLLNIENKPVGNNWLWIRTDHLT